jgi:hypothetical protein
MQDEHRNNQEPDTAVLETSELRSQSPQQCDRRQVNTSVHDSPHIPSTPEGVHCRATAKLLGAALDGGDFEAGSPGVSAAYAPGWVQKSEKIKGDMGLLKDRINKLKECALVG